MFTQLNSTGTTPAPPWGTINSSGDKVDDYPENTFVEIAVNATAMGFDTRSSGDTCEPTLGSVVVKSRSSHSWTSSLKDMGGPFDLGDKPELEVFLTGGSECQDGPVVTLEADLGDSPPPDDTGDPDNLEYSYLWEIEGAPEDWTQVGGDTDKYAAPTNIAGVFKYRVSVTAFRSGIKNCTKTSDPAIVTIFPKPVVSNATDTFCDEDQVDTALSGYDSQVGPGAGYTVVWYSDSNRTIPITSTGATLPIGDNFFYATVTDPITGCKDYPILKIIIIATPACSASNDGQICVGDDLQLYENGGDAISWLWTSDGAATFDNATSQNPIASGAVNGEIFSVTVTDANGCTKTCTTTAVVELCIGDCDTIYGYHSEDVSTCFQDDNFSNWGWTNYFEEEGTYELTLYAGAGGCITDGADIAGTATVIYDNSLVSIEYNINEGYVMNAMQVFVGCEKYPQKGNGDYTVAPGQYPFSAALGGYVQNHTISGIQASGPIYVIAHGVVCEVLCEGAACNAFVDDLLSSAEGQATTFNASITCDEPVAKVTDSFDFTLYPAPFRNTLNVEYKFEYDTNVKIDVFSTTGSLVHSEVDSNYNKGITSTKAINFYNKANQTYVVRVTTNRGSASKMVVSNNK